MQKTPVGHLRLYAATLPLTLSQSWRSIFQWKNPRHSLQAWELRVTVCLFCLRPRSFWVGRQRWGYSAESPFKTTVTLNATLNNRGLLKCDPFYGNNKGTRKHFPSRRCRFDDQWDTPENACDAKIGGHPCSLVLWRLRDTPARLWTPNIWLSCSKWAWTNPPPYEHSK